MKILLLFTLILFSFQQETIYISAYDPVTKTIGQAYSSSGGNFWQHYVKNKGMIGEQASGLRGCTRATPRKLLEEGKTATEIGKILQEQCGSYTQYRLSINTIDGDISSVIAARGCHSQNQICGNRNTTHFSVTGGGLRSGILEAALEKWKKLDPKLNLICRLYLVMKEIYDKGGEIKPFKGASIAVDSLTMDKMFFVRATGPNNDAILRKITEQLPSMCKVYVNLTK